jgi:ankyrin repeat protein
MDFSRKALDAANSALGIAGLEEEAFPTSPVRPPDTSEFILPSLPEDSPKQIPKVAFNDFGELVLEDDGNAPAGAKAMAWASKLLREADASLSRATAPSHSKRPSKVAAYRTDQTKAVLGPSRRTRSLRSKTLHAPSERVGSAPSQQERLARTDKGDRMQRGHVREAWGGDSAAVFLERKPPRSRVALSPIRRHEGEAEAKDDAKLSATVARLESRDGVRSFARRVASLPSLTETTMAQFAINEHAAPSKTPVAVAAPLTEPEAVAVEAEPEAGFLPARYFPMHDALAHIVGPPPAHRAGASVASAPQEPSRRSKKLLEQAHKTLSSTRFTRTARTKPLDIPRRTVSPPPAKPEQPAVRSLEWVLLETEAVWDALAADCERCARSSKPSPLDDLPRAIARHFRKRLGVATTVWTHTLAMIHGFQQYAERCPELALMADAMKNVLAAATARVFLRVRAVVQDECGIRFATKSKVATGRVSALPPEIATLVLTDSRGGAGDRSAAAAFLTQEAVKRVLARLMEAAHLHIAPPPAEDASAGVGWEADLEPLPHEPLAEAHSRAIRGMGSMGVIGTGKQDPILSLGELRLREWFWAKGKQQGLLRIVPSQAEALVPASALVAWITGLCRKAPDDILSLASLAVKGQGLSAAGDPAMMDSVSALKEAMSLAEEADAIMLRVKAAEAVLTTAQLDERRARTKWERQAAHVESAGKRDGSVQFGKAELARFKLAVMQAAEARGQAELAVNSLRAEYDHKKTLEHKAWQEAGAAGKAKAKTRGASTGGDDASVPGAGVFRADAWWAAGAAVMHMVVQRMIRTERRQADAVAAARAMKSLQSDRGSMAGERMALRIQWCWRRRVFWIRLRELARRCREERRLAHETAMREAAAAREAALLADIERRAKESWHTSRALMSKVLGRRLQVAFFGWAHFSRQMHRARNGWKVLLRERFRRWRALVPTLAAENRGALLLQRWLRGRWAIRLAQAELAVRRRQTQGSQRILRRLHMRSVIKSWNAWMELLQHRQAAKRAAFRMAKRPVVVAFQLWAEYIQHCKVNRRLAAIWGQATFRGRRVRRALLREKSAGVIQRAWQNSKQRSFARAAMETRRRQLDRSRVMARRITQASAWKVLLAWRHVVQVHRQVRKRARRAVDGSLRQRLRSWYAYVGAAYEARLFVALNLQSVVRRKRALVAARRLVRRKRALLTMQHWWRGRLVRIEYQRARAQVHASLKIQSLWRGHLARKVARRLHERRAAAVRIQARWRGHAARRDVWWTQQEMLLKAVEQGDFTGVRRTLEVWGDWAANVQDRQGRTALMRAAVHGRRRILKLLLRSGADMHAVAPETGGCVLHLLARLRPFAKQDELLEYLITRGGNPNQADAKGRTPLHVASELGWAPVVSLLLRLRADPEAVDKQRMTPLHLACEHGRLTVVQLLVSSDYPSFVGARDVFANTALHLAAAGGHLAVCQLLVDQVSAPVSARRFDGKTPLHLACQAHPSPAAEDGSNPAFDETVTLLLARGADVTVVDVKGRGPLHIAGEYGRAQAVSLLFEADADVRAKDAQGDTPLHAACRSGRPEAVTAILNHGGMPDDRNKEGNTALHLCCMLNHVSCLRQLLRHQCNPNLKNFNHRTPLGEARIHGHREALAVLLEEFVPVEIDAAGRALRRLELVEQDATAQGMMETLAGERKPPSPSKVGIGLVQGAGMYSVPGRDPLMDDMEFSDDEDQPVSKPPPATPAARVQTGSSPASGSSSVASFVTDGIGVLPITSAARSAHGSPTGSAVGAVRAPQPGSQAALLSRQEVALAWEVRYRLSDGAQFWFNRHTGESREDRPAELGGGWIEMYDSDRQVVYWRNPSTGEVSDVDPVKVAAARLAREGAGKRDAAQPGGTHALPSRVELRRRRDPLRDEVGADAVADYAAEQRVRAMELAESKRRSAAVSMIQAAWKHSRTRRAIREVRKMRIAAIQVQRMWRGWLARRLRERLAWQVRCCVHIQRMVRGLLGRRRWWREWENQRQYWGVVSIQRLWRGFAARRYANTMQARRAMPVDGSDKKQWLALAMACWPPTRRWKGWLEFVASPPLGQTWPDWSAFRSSVEEAAASRKAVNLHSAKIETMAQSVREHVRPESVLRDDDSAYLDDPVIPRLPKTAIGKVRGDSARFYVRWRGWRPGEGADPAGARFGASYFPRFPDCSPEQEDEALGGLVSDDSRAARGAIAEITAASMLSGTIGAASGALPSRPAGSKHSFTRWDAGEGRWGQPRGWVRAERRIVVAEEERRQWGQTMEEENAARAVQWFFRAAKRARTERKRVKAVAMMEGAQDEYLSNPSSIVGKMNYALFCQTVGKELVRAKPLYLGLVDYMTRRGPDHPLVLWGLAILLAMTKEEKFDVIEALAQRAARADEVKGGNTFEMAELGFFSEFLRRDPENVDALFAMALVHTFVHQSIEEAEPLFLKAMSLQPHRAGLVEAFSHALVARGRRDYDGHEAYRRFLERRALEEAHAMNLRLEEAANGDAARAVQRVWRGWRVRDALTVICEKASADGPVGAWKPCTDPDSGLRYWFNLVSKQTSWMRPGVIPVWEGLRACGVVTGFGIVTKGGCELAGVWRGREPRPGPDGWRVRSDERGWEQLAAQRYSATSITASEAARKGAQKMPGRGQKPNLEGEHPVGWQKHVHVDRMTLERRPYWFHAETSKSRWTEPRWCWQPAVLATMGVITEGHLIKYENSPLLTGDGSIFEYGNMVLGGGAGYFDPAAARKRSMLAFAQRTAEAQGARMGKRQAHGKPPPGVLRPAAAALSWIDPGKAPAEWSDGTASGAGHWVVTEEPLSGGAEARAKGHRVWVNQVTGAIFEGLHPEAE